MKNGNSREEEVYFLSPKKNAKHRKANIVGHNDNILIYIDVVLLDYKYIIAFVVCLRLQSWAYRYTTMW